MKNNTGLRIAVFIEGLTLISLVLVAVPLKRIAGLTEAVEVMGPIHGLAFLSFVYFLIKARSAQSISTKTGTRLFIGALIPFGGIYNESWLSKQENL